MTLPRALIATWWSAFAVVVRAKRRFIRQRYAGGRHIDWDPVHCGECGWVGPLRWAFHTYCDDHAGDVEPVDECPKCGNEDLGSPLEGLSAFRWPVIRHIRWWWLARATARHAQWWAEHGIGLGFINDSDRRYLDRVWRGEQ